jgi:hypothetical protein
MVTSSLVGTGQPAHALQPTTIQLPTRGLDLPKLSDNPIPSIPDPPSLDFVKERVTELEAIDLSDMSVDSLVELLRPLLRGFKVELPRWEAGLELFRARTRFDSPPTNTADLWHPPPHLSRIGRANRERMPLLYCSADMSPLPFELHVTEGDRMTVIKFETTEPMIANRIGYTPETFRRLESQREVPEYARLGVDGYSEVGTLINDFLSDVFCQVVNPGEEWRYRLSAAVSEVMLGENEDPINALMYPTIPMWGNVDNFALRSGFASRALQPVHAKFILVTSVQLPEVSYEDIDEARRFGDDGSIGWLGHKGQWKLENQGDELRFEAMSRSYWEARDERGNIVDPE